MAIKRQTCTSHPDRLAIGVCVITSQAICAECSTRYEGVNYSKEGLKILQAQRAKARGTGARPVLGVLAVLTAPLLLLLLFLFYWATFAQVIELAVNGVLTGGN